MAVRLDRVRLERARSFGGVWLGWTLWRARSLDGLVRAASATGARVGAVAGGGERCWCWRAWREPSSELHIAEDWYRKTALEDLLGLPSELVNDDRLYRGLDRLLPHKEAIEKHLKERPRTG